MSPRSVQQAAPDVEVPAGERSGPRAVESWPPGISTRATMRISDVLGALRPEFPALTPSKLRFLEEQGLVEPVRTPAGYRQYSLADVERLRYVLAAQRDKYLPLKVIKEERAELDAGHGSVPLARAVPDGAGELRPADRLTAQSLAESADVDVALVTGLMEAGVIRPDSRGHFDPWTLEVVRIAASVGAHGVEPRHLRAARLAADRSIDLVAAAVAPLRAAGTPSARARAGALGADLGESLAELHTVLLRQGVADLA